eukprot:TRINITY_DN41649_c0_g1_i1.p1 TRINITY_DN41649_c0_g1~~TRINITY_DN41649_c0_g1_i1.p1  ORF type:complete len:996 (+),score=183.64 TRINITY_DN41649_c0_g1_i1:64-3051(+)
MALADFLKADSGGPGGGLVGLTKQSRRNEHRTRICKSLDRSRARLVARVGGQGAKVENKAVKVVEREAVEADKEDHGCRKTAEYFVPLSEQAIAVKGASDGKGEDGDDDLICPLCVEVLFRPVRTHCGHCLCLACLSEWLNGSSAQECPICRSPLGELAIQSTTPTSTTVKGTTAAASPSEEAEEPEDGKDNDGQESPLRRVRFLTSNEKRISLTAVDAELERRAMARLGPKAYYERELDTLGRSMERRLAAYRQRHARGLAEGGAVERLRGSKVVGAGMVASSLATALGIVSSEALGASAVVTSAAPVAAFMTANVAAEALVAGTFFAGGTSAFLAGMRLAAWFDGDGATFCVLRCRFDLDRQKFPAGLGMLNLLDEAVVVRVFAAKKSRIEKGSQQRPGGSSGHANAKSTRGGDVGELGVVPEKRSSIRSSRGSTSETRRSSTFDWASFAASDLLSLSSGGGENAVPEVMRLGSRRKGWQWESCGKALTEETIPINCERTLEVPATAPRELMLVVATADRMINKDLGLCRAQLGQRLLIGEVDESTGTVRRSTPAASFGRAHEGVLCIRDLEVADADERNHGQHAEKAESEMVEANDADGATVVGGGPFRQLATILGQAQSVKFPFGNLCGGPRHKQSVAEESAGADPSHLWPPLSLPAGGAGAAALADGDDDTGPSPWQRHRWHEVRQHNSFRRTAWTPRHSMTDGGIALECGAVGADAKPCVGGEAADNAGRPWKRESYLSTAPSSALRQYVGEPLRPEGSDWKRLWISVHAECAVAGFDDGPVTEAGLADIQGVVQRMLLETVSSGSQHPSIIASSPAQACLASASVLARALGIGAVAIEPALCKVSALHKVAAGFGAASDDAVCWTQALLREHLHPEVAFDDAYEPLITTSELRGASCRKDRRRREARRHMEDLFTYIREGELDGAVLVTHGSLACRLVRELTAETDFVEPPQGSVVGLLARPPELPGKTWGMVESFEVPRRSMDESSR